MKLWIAAVVLLPAAVAGAAPRALTLQDALALALRHNPTLASARVAVVDAQGRELHARGAYQPTLELTASAQDARNDPRASPFPLDLHREQVVAQATITQPFSDGSRLTLRAEAVAGQTTTRVPTGDAASDLTLEAVTPTIEVTFNEPLWGGRRAGRADAAELRALRSAAQLDELATAEQVVRDAEHAYWQLYLAQQELAIRGHAVELADGQLRVVKAEIARGTRPPLAAAEVEDELARRREDQLVAQGAVAERSIALARKLGLPVDGELAAGDPPPHRPATAASDIVHAALAHSPRLQAAMRRGDGAAFELAKVEDGARWRVDAFVHGSLSQPGDDARAALAATAGYGGWMIETGITVRLPLGTAAARGATDSARAQLVRQRIEVADVEAEVAAAATGAANRLGVAVQRRAALARSVELAQQNLDAEQRRWQRGDTTSFEVLRRQTALADTQLRAERARIDEIAAGTDVEALTGALLPNRRVVVADALAGTGETGGARVR
jgi:outer membrane protein TolC